ncbi:MAG: hypothetical protein CMC93_00490 [Flavobacteriaceae bacterium]|mgnify:CR=1 FL=1|nr:hypothetical protein [Flavobacteriaceae bacterium]|tara:strand:+ start:3541 stop:4128 length:588 start_codon:yes stop_codon:yes gene_type:complete
MDRISSVLPSLTCKGVGNGWTAYGYKAAAEVIFLGFLWNVAQWFMQWAYAGVKQAELLVAPAVKAYEDMCLTSAQTGYANWYRSASKTINTACLDAAKFREQTIFNVNEALREAREYIVDLIWKANATVATPVAVSGANDIIKGDFTTTQNIASLIFNSRHELVCKIALGLEKAFQSSSSCARKRRRVDQPELKL